jgi:hypothetical protein
MICLNVLLTAKDAADVPKIRERLAEGHPSTLLD